MTQTVGDNEEDKNKKKDESQTLLYIKRAIL